MVANSFSCLSRKLVSYYHTLLCLPLSILLYLCFFSDQNISVFLSFLPSQQYPPPQPYPCHILLSWDSRETDSLEDLNSTPFRHLQTASLRRATSGTPRSGPDNVVGPVPSSYQPSGDPISPSPASAVMNSVTAVNLGASAHVGNGMPVLTSCVSHAPISHSGSTSGPGTSGCVGGPSASALYESFVLCRDSLKLAYHLAQRMWSIGLPCELLTTPNVVSALL